MLYRPFRRERSSSKDPREAPTELFLLISPIPRRVLSLVCAAFLAVAIGPTRLQAQAIATGPAAEEAATGGGSNGPAGIVPSDTGFNATLSTAAQHDSSSGWSSFETPTAAYRFTSRWSMDASLPIYTYINIDANRGTKAKPVFKYVTKHGAPGDTALAGHLDLSPALFDSTSTFTLGLPTGKTAYGLGAGKVTWNFTNHFEQYISVFTPDIEIGIGDSSSLVGRRIRKSFTSVGTMANFQAGSAINLPRQVDFECDAYEQLPFSKSTIYSTTGRGKKKVTNVLSTSSAEDNGFTNTLDIPVAGHVTLSGYYNRSLRLHDDVAGFSLTLLLKATPSQPDTVE